MFVNTLSRLSAQAEVFHPYQSTSGSSSSATTSDPSTQHVFSPTSFPFSSSSISSPSPPFPPQTRTWNRSPRGITSENERGRTPFRSQKSKMRAQTEAATAFSSASNAAATMRLAANSALSCLLEQAKNALLNPYLMSSLPDASSTTAIVGSIPTPLPDAITAALSASTVATTIETILRERKGTNDKRSVFVKKHRHLKMRAKSIQKEDTSTLSSLPSSLEEITQVIEDTSSATLLYSVLARLKTLKSKTSNAMAVCNAVKRLSSRTSSEFAKNESNESIARILSLTARTWSDSEFINVSPISLSAYISSGCTDLPLLVKILAILSNSATVFPPSVAVKVLSDVTSLVSLKSRNDWMLSRRDFSFNASITALGDSINALVLQINSTTVSTLVLQDSCLRSLIGLRIQALPLVLKLAASALDSTADFTAPFVTNTLSCLVTFRVSDIHLLKSFSNAAHIVSNDMNTEQLISSIYSLTALLTMSTDVTTVSNLHGTLSRILHRADSIVLPETLSVATASQLLIAREISALSSPSFVDLFPETLRERCVSYNAVNFRSKQKHKMITSQATEVAAALMRIGYTPRLSESLLDGALTVDILITEPRRIVIFLKGPDCYHSEKYYHFEESHKKLPRAETFTETGDSFLRDLVIKKQNSDVYTSESSSSSNVPLNVLYSNAGVSHSTAFVSHSIPYFLWCSLGGCEAHDAHDAFVTELLLKGCL
jgi:hypothetical protein